MNVRGRERSNATAAGARVGSLLRRSAPWLIASALAFAGLAKLNDPTPASDFLVDLVSVRSVGLVRVIAAVEVALALWLIVGVGRRAALLAAAAAFTGFAVVHGWASGAGVATACGCAGAGTPLDSVPAEGWIGINAGLALLAALAVARPRDRATTPGARGGGADGPGEGDST